MNYSEGTVDAWRRWILLAWAVAGTVFAIILAGTLGSSPSPSISPALGQLPPTVAQAGRTADDFHLRSFAGGILSLADFRGRPVILNFWASWCYPCRDEMLILERVWREFRDREVVMLGVDVDDDYDDAAAFLKRLQISYPNVYDPEQTRLQAYRVTGLPTTVFLDTQLRIRAQDSGGYVGESGYRDLRARVQALHDQRQIPSVNP